MRWEFLYGGRMLKGRRSLFSPMTWVALAGIAFGLAATLVTLSVMDGFETAYEEAILGFNAHIVLIQDGEENEKISLDDILTRFKKEGIRASTPFIFREGLGVMPDQVSGVVLKGVDPKTMREVYPIRFDPIGGRNPEGLLEEQGKNPPAILGKILLKQFFPQGIPKNPEVRVVVPKGKFVSLKDLSETFTVVGTFESGLNEFDSQFILTSLPVMKGIFDTPNYNGMELVLHDKSKAHDLARRLEEALPPAYQAISWDELNEPLFAAMKMEKRIFLIMMLLIVGIASFNVMGVIFMLIVSRKPDIAILKALGGRKGGIVRAFSVNGLILGGIGILAGEVLAAAALYSLARFKWFALDPEIYFISRLPVAWSSALWGVITALAFLICYGVSRFSAAQLVKQAEVVQTYR
ncbi:MAG: ABC transporter permease [Deltaproteobacteria bacterium]|nr:ABC transporter permease [Deltaproteobacteria bacterium]